MAIRGNSLGLGVKDYVQYGIMIMGFVGVWFKTTTEFDFEIKVLKDAQQRNENKLAAIQPEIIDYKMQSLKDEFSFLKMGQQDMLHKLEVIHENIRKCSGGDN